MDNNEASELDPGKKEGKSGQISPKESQKTLLKIVKKPEKKRDTDNEKMPVHTDEEESTSEEEETAQLIHDVKENEQTKAVRAEKKSKKSYSTLHFAREAQRVRFSLLSIETYIDANFSGMWFYAAMIVYIVFGCFLLLFLPVLVLSVKKIPFPKMFVAVSQQPDICLAQENFKLAVFLACMFVTYLFLREVFGQSVLVCIVLFKFLNVKISKDIKVFLFIVNELKHLLTLFFFFTFAIIECNVFLEDYSVFQKSVVHFEKVGAYSLCLVIFLFLFLLEKVFLKVTVAYLGNNVFSRRIGDVNLKLCIVRRLFIYSEALRLNDFGDINNELLSGIEITDSFLLSHEDFKLSSTQNCEEIVASIYEHLNIQALKEENIRTCFGRQWEDIWKYLQNNIHTKGDQDMTEVSYEEFCAFTKSGYTEKIDLKRTLYDRDKLLGKLDTILGSVAVGLTLMISTPIVGFDMIKYMAGLFPLIMSSGWLFSDIIKEVFKNFIFLLHEHPFDVGDKVIVKDREFTVLRIDLMYTTFTSKGGTVCYIPNCKMIEESIFNIRRSDIQTEIVKIMVKELLTIDGVSSIKAKIVEILNHKSYEGKTSISVQDYEIQDDSTFVFFKIEYLTNFQDPEPKFTRRQKPIQIIQQAIKDNSFTYMEQKVANAV
ncbi:hypothetical protein NECID01_1120 [Nematocida sp. AWRm77]|nr:hypothetical protein NECID01_1120 [Nematocida sp. AWRm77]